MLALPLPQPPYALPRALISSLVNTPMVLVLIARQSPLAALRCQQKRGRVATSIPDLAAGAGREGCTGPARRRNGGSRGLPARAASTVACWGGFVSLALFFSC